MHIRLTLKAPFQF